MFGEFLKGFGAAFFFAPIAAIIIIFLALRIVAACL